MGRVIDGEWVTRDLGADEQGRYVRRAAKFRDTVTADGASGFPAARGRYHLYVSKACGWSHRALIVRALKGLEDVISASEAEPFMGEHGWTFSPDADPVNGFRHLYEAYVKADPGYTGRASVPVLWDKETGSVVTNESFDIMQAFDSAFDDVGARPGTWFPAELRESIVAMIDANYGPVNNGVYRCGFASSQAAYDEAVNDLFARLDELDALLATQRYLLGDRLTAADICLFPTLFRFDAVYHYHFKCNVRRLVDYDHLWAFTRDVYQTPGVRETCDLDVAREHYFTSHESISPRRIIPAGPRLDFDAPHGREGVG